VALERGELSGKRSLDCAGLLMETVVLVARLVSLGCWLFCAFQSLAGEAVASRLPFLLTHSD